MNTCPRALSGIRVLDLTRILAGPFATMKLADQGAEVIKLEQPGAGDDTRGWGPPFIYRDSGQGPPVDEGESAYFLAVNRGKKSVTLNLKHPEGKRIFDLLLGTADVVVSNFRPGTMEKLGISWKHVQELNPRAIYCTISGYGDDGQGRASYDVVVQGECGVMDLTGRADGPPTKVGISVADLYAGTLAVEGILLALLSRASTGRGQRVDIALLDGMLSLLTYQGQEWLSCGKEPARRGNAHPSIVPYETFEASDGHLNIGVASESLWAGFCELIGQPELAADPRFASNAERVRNREALIPIIAATIKAKPRDHWLATFEEEGIPAGPIRKVSEVLSDPARRERKMVVDLEHPKLGKLAVVGNPVKLSETPPALGLPPPLLGQHSWEVIGGLGYTRDKFEQLRKEGVV